MSVILLLLLLHLQKGVIIVFLFLWIVWSSNRATTIEQKHIEHGEEERGKIFGNIVMYFQEILIIYRIYVLIFRCAM